VLCFKRLKEQQVQDDLPPKIHGLSDWGCAMMDEFDRRVLKSQQGKLRASARQWKKDGLSPEESIRQATCMRPLIMMLYRKRILNELPMRFMDKGKTWARRFALLTATWRTRRGLQISTGRNVQYTKEKGWFSWDDRRFVPDGALAKTASAACQAGIIKKRIVASIRSGNLYRLIYGFYGAVRTSQTWRIGGSALPR